MVYKSCHCIHFVLLLSSFLRYSFLILILFSFFLCSKKIESVQIDKDIGISSIPSEFYHLGTGDIVKIVVWSGIERIFDMDIQVDDFGQIALPYLGSVYVRGMTIQNLRNIVEEKFSERMQNIVAHISIVQKVSKKIYVLGEVDKQSIIFSAAPLSLLEAILYSGGTKKGAKTQVFIIRKNKIIKVDLEKEGKDVYLYPEDIVFVPKTVYKEIVDVLSDLSPALSTLLTGIGIVNIIAR